MSAAASWWLSGGISAANCIAAYQPKQAASLAASYVNLANPGTNNAAPGSAPTQAGATGWTFGGGQYLTTGIVPTSSYSMIIRFNGCNASTLIGTSTAGGTTIFYMRILAASFRYANGATQDIAPTVSTGVFAMAGNQGYRNGTADGSTIATGASGVTQPIYIGALNNAGVASQFVTGDIYAAAIYNTTITAGQVAALYTAMQAL